MTATLAPHPAKFSETILDTLRDIAPTLPGPILDPFAGTGRIHDIGRDDTIGVELEPEWAAHHPRTLIGNATALPFPDASIGSIATSPAYGNRFADNYAGKACPTCRSAVDVMCSTCRGTGRDPDDVRATYRIKLGRPLSVGSGASLQWGRKYRELHVKAWIEARRVIRPGGVFVLNCSDHIRGGTVQPVTAWHVDTLVELGFNIDDWHDIKTHRNRRGANSDLRVDTEDVVVLRLPGA